MKHTKALIRMRLTTTLSLFDLTNGTSCTDSDFLNLSPIPYTWITMGWFTGSCTCYAQQNFDTGKHFVPRTFIMFLQYNKNESSFFFIYHFTQTLQAHHKIVKLPCTWRRPERSVRRHISKERCQYSTISVGNISNDDLRTESILTLQSPEECLWL